MQSGKKVVKMYVQLHRGLAVHIQHMHSMGAACPAGLHSDQTPMVQHESSTERKHVLPHTRASPLPLLRTWTGSQSRSRRPALFCP